MSVCPECRSGKHVNCVGMAWDDEIDGQVICGCDCPEGVAARAEE